MDWVNAAVSTLFLVGAAVIAYDTLKTSRQEKESRKNLDQRKAAFEQALDRALRGIGPDGKGDTPPTFESRLNRSADALRRSADDMQKLLAGFEQYVADRAASAKEAEQRLQDLASREEELRTTLDQLEALRPGAVAQLTEAVGQVFDSGDQRSRRREWRFFIAGLLCSVPLGILVNQIS